MNTKMTENLSALECALSILKKWDCSDAQISNILDLNSDVHQEKSQTANTDLTSEQSLRINCIIDIDEALKGIFTNPQNSSGFMQMKNHNNFFEGRTPISVIETGSLDSLREVTTRIQTLALR